MSFSLTPLVGDRVIVQGDDFTGTTGKCVLDAAQWNGIKQDKKYNQAVEAFDAAVEEFFAPLLEAAETAANAATPDVPEDSIEYVVLQEEVEGTQAQPAQLIHLNRDSVILRLIEDEQDHRLVWVDGTLEILELASAIADGS